MSFATCDRDATQAPSHFQLDPPGRSSSRQNFKIGKGATMQTQIIRMINDFEHGRLSRRQLIAYLTGMFAASLGATTGLADQQDGRAATNAAESAPTFDATDLNHVALNVTDVQRSQKWCCVARSARARRPVGRLDGLANLPRACSKTGA
jgi:hypothetical protein